jgi:hypothetical protein
MATKPHVNIVFNNEDDYKQVKHAAVDLDVSLPEIARRFYAALIRKDRRAIEIISESPAPSKRKGAK